jgi:hypothetical protein
LLLRARERKQSREEEQRGDWFMEKKHRRGEEGGRNKVTHSLSYLFINKVPVLL